MEYRSAGLGLKSARCWVKSRLCLLVVGRVWGLGGLEKRKETAIGFSGLGFRVSGMVEQTEDCEILQGSGTTLSLGNNQ